METLINFFGRFHPLVVHLPIGIIILAFLFEALSLIRRYRKLRTAIQPSLLIGAFFALVSVATGLALAREGGYDDDGLSAHRNAGILTAVLAIAVFFLRKNKWVLHTERSTKRPVRLAIFLPLMLALTATGHLGGSLTHGEEFITQFATLSKEEVVSPAEKIKAIADVREAVLYHDVVQPILEAKCYGCHSSKKQKGELRLDGTEYMLKGGKHGDVIENGVADSSALFSRLLLPLEDEHHMPPNERPQLSSAEIDLIRVWINDGASFDRKIKNMNESADALQYITLLVESSEIRSWLPEEEVSEAGDQALSDIRATGAMVIRVSGENNYLRASLAGTRDTTIRLDRLLPVKDQLISLRLSHCNITGDDVSVLGQLRKLAWLYLDHTSVSDNDLAHLGNLPQLKYLNLVGTKVSDASVPHISRLSTLEEIYLFQSGITPQGVEQLKVNLPNLKVDTGSYQLPRLPTDTIVFKKI